MSAYLYLLFIGVLAFQLRARMALLESFHGLPRYLGSLALTLFLVNWVNFLLYVIFGAGDLDLRLSWGLLVFAVFYFSEAWKSQPGGGLSPLLKEALVRLRAWRTWNYWFLFLAVFVLARFYAGIDIDDENNVWSTFNFVDTAFHLSVVNAFLAAPHFPPMDLDMAPYPLKYHFLADFNVAHLVRLGLPALTAIWLMNLVSAAAMVGTLWSVFARWLKLPPRWVMLAALMFLFLNSALVNVIHYVTLKPAFFDPDNLFYGLLRFPYFNFEYIQANMLEPQRGLLFALPVALLVLDATFGRDETPETLDVDRVRLLQSFALICLLPLAHIIAFAVIAPCLLQTLWRHARWFFSRPWFWLPFLAIGVLQLLYLGFYGPPTNASFSSWAVQSTIPLRDYAALPGFLRRMAFWFFANGDFLFWGVLFTALAFAWHRRRGSEDETDSGLWAFLLRWRWYLAVCVFFFALINVFRYSFDWGDSNKLVFFLNLGLSLIIALGAARWTGRRHGWLSHAFWVFFFVLSVAPPTYSFYDNVIAPGNGDGTVLLFEKNGRKAAEWIRTKLGPKDVVLTAANNTFHFITPLTGRPTLAGIYGDSNPYRQDDRTEAIRRVYEDGNLQLLKKLSVQYVCVSRGERRRYQLSPIWAELMKSGTAVVYHSGEGPQDYHSVYLFDASRL